MTSLEACLPESMRGARLERLSGGLSGAGVYRVEAAGAVYVLKLAGEAAPLDAWQQRVDIQRRAAELGVAPQVVHVDEARRAVVSEHVTNRGFAPRLHGPATRAAAIQQLGELIRRVHQVPPPAGAIWREPRELVAPLWAELAEFAMPRFVRSAIEEVLAEPPPARTAEDIVISHNDMNPSNLVFDGARLLLLDWDVAGLNDRFHDLATVAVFLRLDDATCAALLAAYDGTPPPSLPAGFLSTRRFVAVFYAAMFLRLAQHAGHTGGEVALAQAPTLADVHGLIGAGALTPGSADGAWAFALALVRTLAR